MNTIFNGIQNGWKYFSDQVKSIGVSDIIDILLVAVLLYYLYLFISERRAGKLAVGVGLLILLQLLSELFSFTTISFILKNIFQVGILAVVVIFQPELRSFLEKIGGSSFRNLKGITDNKLSAEQSRFINELSDSVKEMSESKTGALILIERETKLGDIISTGTKIDAEISSLLIRNIFFNKSPLHDGAIVIRDNRIEAAGCILPIVTRTTINKDLGTRHRAALGASESSDALIIVVSEETGIISIAFKGTMVREYDITRLKTELEEMFVQYNYHPTNKKKRKQKSEKKES